MMNKANKNVKLIQLTEVVFGTPEYSDCLNLTNELVKRLGTEISGNLITEKNDKFFVYEFNTRKWFFKRFSIGKTEILFLDESDAQLALLKF